jgi:homopolymeric O-antigen transport system ATP-binding protein
MSDAITVGAGPAAGAGWPTGDSAAGRDMAISVRDLSKRYRLEQVGGRGRHGGLLRRIARRLAGRPSARPPVKEFWALHGVTFDIARGERVGVIGRNGAGKTTLLKILSRIVAPTEGEARVRGRLTSLLEVGTGFNDALTGRENIFVNASLHGRGARETAERLEEIVEFSGIDRRFIDMRVKHYSTGMRVRLAFSVAAHLDAEILLLDEVLAVGDLAFQEKCLERVQGMLQTQRTVVFVSHDLNSLTRFCERAIWLEQGRIVLDGPARDVVAAYAEQVRRAVSLRRWTRAPAAVTTGGSPVPEAPRAAGGLGGDDGAFLGAGAIIAEAPWAEMVSVSVIDADERELKAGTVDQAIGIEFVYDILRSGKVVLPAANFHTADDILMFTAVYTDPEYMRRPKERGRYRSVVWIPPHLLNVGPIKVTVSLTTPVSGKLERHVVIPAALSFEVCEAPLGVHSSRGSYREVKGIVRPLLDWHTVRLK